MARTAARTAASLLAFVWLAACGSDPHPEAPYRYAAASSADVLNGNNSGSGSSAGPGSSPSTTPTITPVSNNAPSNNGAANQNQENNSVSNPPMDPALRLIEECGGIDETKASEEIVNENLRGVGVVTNGNRTIFGPFSKDYTVTATPSLALRATSEVNVTNLSFATLAEPEGEGEDADAAAKKASGSYTTEMLPLSGRAAALASLTAWDKIVCTVQPAKKLTVQTGGSNVVVQFDPPLPHSLSPRPVIERFETELPRDRQWTGIKATVVNSNNAAVAAGAVFTGMVSLRKIALNASVAASDGAATTNVAGDVAYELIVDFGGPEVTNALGLKPSTKYYLDARLHRFSAVVADSLLPSTEGVPALMVFLAQ